MANKHSSEAKLELISDPSLVCNYLNGYFKSVPQRIKFHKCSVCAKATTFLITFRKNVSLENKAPLIS